MNATLHPAQVAASLFDGGKSALLLIDLQRDFLEPTGRLPVEAAAVSRLIEVANAAIARARRAGAPIYNVVNHFPRWSVANLFRKFAAIEGSPGAELDPRIDAAGAELSPKWASDAFCNDALAASLAARGVEHLVLIGVYAGGCVLATLKSARRRGFRVTVLADGVASGSGRSTSRALARYQALGAQVVSTC